MVGTNATVESEGYGRESLALPGRQDELVAAVNPRTVVIVDSGSPVLTPRRNDVSAVLLARFGGQEHGDGLSCPPDDGYWEPLGAVIEYAGRQHRENPSKEWERP